MVILQKTDDLIQNAIDVFSLIPYAGYTKDSLLPEIKTPDLSDGHIVILPDPVFDAFNNLSLPL